MTAIRAMTNEWDRIVGITPDAARMAEFEKCDIETLEFFIASENVPHFWKVKDLIPELEQILVTKRGERKTEKEKKDSRNFWMPLCVSIAAIAVAVILWLFPR